MRLKRPRAQVRRDVEARVDVPEIVDRARLDLQRLAEQLDIARPHRGHVVRLVELELVHELRAVAADEEQEVRGAFGREGLRAREVEPPREPRGIVRQVLHQHRPAFGDRAVAEPTLLHRELGAGVRKVLSVTGLVEERVPVVAAAHRPDHEHHLPRHLDRRAERARRLVLAILRVDVHVLLRLQVDTEVGQRPFEGGKHLVGREEIVPLRCAKDARRVPALCFIEPDADAAAEQPVDGILVEVLGRVEERTALLGEVVEAVLELVGVEVAVVVEVVVTVLVSVVLAVAVVVLVAVSVTV